MILNKIIHERLYLYSVSKKIERKKVYELLGVLFHIPRDNRIEVIKELEDNKVLERLNQHEFKIKEPIVK